MRTEARREDPAEITACLKVEVAPINLAGAYGKYTINESRETIDILCETAEFIVAGVIPMDQLSTLIRELQAIERNIDKAQPRLEVW